MRIAARYLPRSRIAFPRGTQHLSGLAGLGHIVPSGGLTESYTEQGTGAFRTRPIPQYITTTDRGGPITRENPAYVIPGWISEDQAIAQVGREGLKPQWSPPSPLTRESFFSSRLPGYGFKTTYVETGRIGQIATNWVSSAQAMLNEGAWYAFGVSRGFIDTSDSFLDKIGKVVDLTVTVIAAVGIGYGLVAAAGAAGAAVTAPSGAAPVAVTGAVAPATIAPAIASPFTAGVVAAAPVAAAPVASGFFSTIGTLAAPLVSTAQTAAVSAATGLVGQKATDAILKAIGLAPGETEVEEMNPAFSARPKSDFLKTAFPWIVAVGIIGIGLIATGTLKRR
jgi:hypothetical protein